MRGGRAFWQRHGAARGTGTVRTDGSRVSSAEPRG